MNVSHRTWLAALAILGLLPALAIVFLFRFEDGDLVVLGQSVAAFDLNRLYAAVLSIFTPIYLILPLALSGFGGRRGARFWIGVFAAPWLLLAPSWLAGLWAGAGWSGLPPIALFLLSILAICLVLWLACLRLVCSFGLAAIVYGAVWACSSFIDYLGNYVAPYFEMPLVKSLLVVNWILPQVQSGLALIDAFLQTGVFPWPGFAPTLVQLPILAAILLWHHRFSIRK